MAYCKVFNLLLYLSLVYFTSAFIAEDLTYTDFFSTLGTRLKSQQNIQSQLLQHRHVFEDIGKLYQRDKLLQAESYFSDRFDLSQEAVSFNVSEKCLNHTMLIISSLIQGEGWAVNMFDAMGKLPSGLMSGNLVWLGSYDECVKVKATIYNNETGILVQESPFVGKYCLAMIPITSLLPANPVAALYAALRVGMCLPDSCSNSDATALVNTVLSLVPIGNTSLVASATCQENNLQYDTKAIAVLVVCSIFIILMAVATLYDVFVIQLPRQQLIAKETDILNGEVPDQLENKLNQDEYKPLLGDRSPDSGPGVLGELLLSFSVYTNGRKLLSTKQPPGSLKAVHGIRFLSMTWVIMGHSFGFGLANTVNVGSFFPDVIDRWTYQAIINASVSVDSFFTISGLLMAYLVLKELKKNNGKLNWAMYYFHRFWRLTPPYMLVMMVYIPLFPNFSNGPVWPQKGVEKDFCKDSWWTNLLYINNFVKTGSGQQAAGGQSESCMAWSWYLANDMQFYIVSPLLFVPLFFSEVVGVIACLVAILAVFTSAGVISSTENLPPGLLGGGGDPTKTGAFFVDYYIKPYCRMGPYIVGILTGYILYKTNCRCKIHWLLNAVIWAVAAGLACAILYGLYDPVNGRNVLSVEVTALYNATNRTVWGACLCWVIFSCVTGNGGFVNTILSWGALVPLSRLTYCAYLIHPVLMSIYYQSVRQPMYITDMTLIWLYLAFLMVSYGVAFGVSLAFESPMMGLERVIFKRGEKKRE